MTISSKQSVLIVGAGEFGSSTAVSLLRSGKNAVTILDRASVLPAEDAASTDLNKVVRFDYSDSDYAELAWQAIEEWRKPEWQGIYNESGVVILGDKSAGPYNNFAEKAMINAEKHSTVDFLKTSTEINSRLDPKRTGISASQADRWGYFNPAGGWAHAKAAVEKLHESIRALGGTIVPGAPIESLVFANGDVRGARMTDGREFIADKVIMATGSWTPTLLKNLLPKDIVQATGQVIAAVQLDNTEAERYRDVPVIMCKDGSGFYCFPPNKDRIMKMATSAGGYLTEDGSPRTTLSPKAAKHHQQNNLSWLPKEEEHLLRNKFASFYPQLGDRPFSLTRMCFYSDVPGGDWIIDQHSEYPSLLVASGGSGHAFKFLPIIGSLIHQRLENTLPRHLAEKWALKPRSGVDPARATMKPVPLRLDNFAPCQI